MIIFSISIMMLSTLMFIQLNHHMIMNIIIQTLLTYLMEDIYPQHFDSPMSFFLIFLGSMLVLFLCITSLEQNELFKMTFKILLFLPIIIIMALLIYIMEPILMSTQINSNDMIFMLETNTNLIQYYLSKLYNYPTHYITIMLVSYLL